MSSRKVTRREFVGASSFLALGLPVVLGRSYPLFAAPAAAPAATYTPPQLPAHHAELQPRLEVHRRKSLGPATRQAGSGGVPGDAWRRPSTTPNGPPSPRRTASTTSTPSASSSPTAAATGAPTRASSWYRKHFKLPAAAAGHQVFIEFEGMRQAGDIYLNGKPVGLYENGVTAYGIDITAALHFRRPGERARGQGGQHHAATRNAPSAPPTPRTPTARPASAPATMERQRLQPRPRRHQPPRLAARHRQDLPDPAALLRPGEPGRLHPLPTTSTSPARLRTSPSTPRCTTPRATAPRSASRPSIVDQQRPRPGPVRRRPSGHGGRREDRAVRHRPADQRALLEPRRPLSLRRLHHAERGREGRRCQPASRPASARPSSRAARARAASTSTTSSSTSRDSPQRSADEWAGVGAGYPDWMHDYTAQADPRLPRQLHALDARRAAEGGCGLLRPLRHRPGLPRRRQGSATSRAASGTSASR